MEIKAYNPPPNFENYPFRYDLLFAKSSQSLHLECNGT